MILNSCLAVGLLAGAASLVITAPLKAEVPVGCYYDGQYYSNGAKDCQVFESMKCDNGTWDDTGSWCL
ncbi:MAG: hypothetical protein ACRD1A_05710 [Terriglobales bacterium]